MNVKNKQKIYFIRKVQGSKTIGVSASTKAKELYSAEIILRNDITDLLATRAQNHRSKRNQAPYEVKGFRLFDQVSYNGTECFITGRRTSGYFALKTLDGTPVHDSAKAQDLRLLKWAGNYILERRAG